MDVIKREGLFSKKSSIKINVIIFIGTISALLISRFKINQKNVVFVNLGNHSFSSSFKDNLLFKIKFAENSFLRIIDGSSLIELDAIYYLIHDAKLNKFIKKIVLSILLNWLNLKIIRSNSIFIVYEDFYGKSSILTTLGNIIPLPVVGIQHGVMMPEYLKDANIYPGIRTKLEFVINYEYKKIMENKKRYGSKILIGGPVLFQNLKKTIVNKENKITFISSGDLQKENFLYLLKKIEKIMILGNYKVLVRPHPSEDMKKIPFGIAVDKRRKSSIFESPCEKELFIGFYSTLLYELSIMGYKTIWIASSSNEPRIQILKLKNASIISEYELSADIINNIFREPIKDKVNFDQKIKDALLTEICLNANEIGRNKFPF